MRLRGTYFESITMMLVNQDEFDINMAEEIDISIFMLIKEPSSIHRLTALCLITTRVKKAVRHSVKALPYPDEWAAYRF